MKRAAEIESLEEFERDFKDNQRIFEHESATKVGQSDEDGDYYEPDFEAHQEGNDAEI